MVSSPDGFTVAMNMSWPREDGKDLHMNEAVAIGFSVMFGHVFASLRDLEPARRWAPTH
jgi:hypothetical protein